MTQSTETPWPLDRPGDERAESVKAEPLLKWMFGLVPDFVPATV